MKKLLYMALLLTLAAPLFSQIKISELPTYPSPPNLGMVPVVIGGVTYKVQANKIAALLDTSNKFVNRILKNTGGDSIVFYIGVTRYAILDRSGSGGSGSDSAVRKGYGTIIDISGTSRIISVDSFRISTRAFRQKGMDSLGAIKAGYTEVKDTIQKILDYIVLDSVQQILSFSSYCNSLNVKDTLRGGRFDRYVGADTADNYMVFQDALGRKWQRFVQDGVLNARWFKFKSFNVSLTNAQNDMAPYMRAMLDYVNAHHRFDEIYIPEDKRIPNIGYFFLTRVILDAKVKIRGDGGINYPRTKLLSWVNTGLFFQPYLKADGDITNTELENLWLSASTSTDSSIALFETRAQTHWKNVLIDGTGGNGGNCLTIIATSNVGDSLGNADRSSFINCSFKEGYNGTYIYGDDANKIIFTNCEWVSNKRWGLWDNGFLGNTINSPHFAYNGVNGINSKSVCSYAGKYYVSLIDTGSSNINRQPDISPTYWSEITGLAATAWDNNFVYMSGGTYAVTDLNAWSKAYDVYSECSQPPAKLNTRSELTAGDNCAGVIASTGGIYKYIITSTERQTGSKEYISADAHLSVGAIRPGGNTSSLYVETPNGSPTSIHINALGAFSSIKFNQLADGGVPAFVAYSGGARYMQFYPGNTLVMKLQETEGMLPGANNTFDIGQTGLQWKDIWAQTYHGNGTYLTGILHNLASIGSAYPLSVNVNGADIKSIAAKYGVILDSATTGEIGIKLDSAILNTFIKSLVHDSLNAQKVYFENGSDVVGTPILLVKNDSTFNLLTLYSPALSGITISNIGDTLALINLDTATVFGKVRSFWKNPNIVSGNDSAYSRDAAGDLTYGKLQPASSSLGGVLTNGTQSYTGNKTSYGQLKIRDSINTYPLDIESPGTLIQRIFSNSAPINNGRTAIRFGVTGATVAQDTGYAFSMNGNILNDYDFRLSELYGGTISSSTSKTRIKIKKGTGFTGIGLGPGVSGAEIDPTHMLEVIGSTELNGTVKINKDSLAYATAARTVRLAFDTVTQQVVRDTINIIAGITGLPSQTGNSGKHLTTNGTVASWQESSSVQSFSGGGTFALSGVDYIWQEITGSGSTSLTLPTAVGKTGRQYGIKNTGGGTVTFTTTSSQTIDGASTLVVSGTNGYALVQSNGANWNILANSGAGGTGDMVLASAQTVTGAKTFNDTKLQLRNVANTFNGSFTNTNTADRVYTLKDAAGTVAFTSDITGTNSGTNTGDQTITLTGGVTGSGTGSFAATVITNANLTGDVTSSGNAATVVKINGTTMSGLATGILKNTTGTGVPSIAVAGDFPTLNQSTTGSAATLTTSRNINGIAFNGSANISVPSDIAAGANGNIMTSNGTIWTSATPTPTGNVSNSGTPVSGQAAEWTSATAIQGVSVTGTGSYAKGTSPTISLPSLNNISGTYTTTATAAATTTLTVSSTAEQFFTGVTTQTVVTPNATTLVVGMSYRVVNNSSGVVTLNKNGGTLIKSLASGTEITIQVTDIGTAAGTWVSNYSTDIAIGASTGTTLNLTGALTAASSTVTGLMKSASLNLGFQTIASASGTTTLTATSVYETEITGTLTQNIDLPDATTLTVGHRYAFSNNSTGLVTVKTNGGATLWIIGASVDLNIVVTDIGTAAGTWEIDYRVGNNSSGKVATFNSTNTWSGTDAQTYTFPTTTATIARTDAAQTFAGTQTLSAGLVTAAGTTALTPIILTNGALATNSVAGGIENDGITFYGSTTATDRGVIPSVKFTSSTATFAVPNSAAAFPLFATTEDAFNVVASTSYFFEGSIEITGMGATTRTTGTLFGGTATITSIAYTAMIQTGTANALSTTQSTKRCATATSNVLNATAATAAEYIYYSGIVRINAGGTFIPQMIHSADPTGTILLSVNNWFKMTPIGTNTVLKSGLIN